MRISVRKVSTVKKSVRGSKYLSVKSKIGTKDPSVRKERRGYKIDALTVVIRRSEALTGAGPLRRKMRGDGL